MDSLSAEKQRQPQVLFIDDAWAAPARGKLVSCIPQIREILQDYQDVRDWFSSEYGTTGEVSDPTYFDAWLREAEQDIKFWQRLSSSPKFNELQDNWGEIANIWRESVILLEQVRKELEEKGFEVVLQKQLPDATQLRIPEVIVLDYVLSEEADPEKIRESNLWLSAISDHCINSDDAKPPLVLLISTSLRSQDRETKAKAFRLDSKTRSSYFRFVPKTDADFSCRIVNHAKYFQETTSERLSGFYSVYKGLKKGYQNAAAEITKSIDDLELEDLATFHAAQLQKEDTLDEYLAWLFGQVLTSKLLRCAEFVGPARIVQDSDEVLLGQLKPQQLIPALFYEASFFPSTEQVLLDAGVAEIRFANVYKAACENNVVLLVISQTCDLTHNKITNDQVLCVEGTLNSIDVKTEASLLKLTIDQIDRKHQVYQIDGKYYSIDWGEFKNLRTLSAERLNNRKLLKLIGRLNELYALSIQSAALQELGRIGLPITPHFVYYIAKISIAVALQGRGRVAEVDIDSGDIIGVIRPQKGGCDLHIAADIRIEIADKLTTLLEPAYSKHFNTKQVAEFLNLLRGHDSKALNGSGDLGAETGISFKHIVVFDQAGERKPQSNPAFVKAYAKLEKSKSIDDKNLIEIVFQPIK
ncbi:hypothetical protein [Sideroxyarcus sp. TK5]